MRSHVISSVVVAQCLVGCAGPAVDAHAPSSADAPRAKVSADWGGDVGAYDAETGTQWLSRPDLSATCQPSLRLDLAADGVVPSTWYIPQPIVTGDDYEYASNGPVASATWLPLAGGAALRLEAGTIVVSAIEDSRLVLDVDGVFCDGVGACDTATVAVEIDGISDVAQSYRDLGSEPTGCGAESAPDPDALLLDGRAPCGRCPSSATGDSEAAE